MSLFAKAVEKGATASGKKKVEKTEVVITEPAFHLSLSRLAEVNAEIDSLSAEAAVLGAEVKERGVQEFIKLYKENKKYPGSFLIKAVQPTQRSASLMFIPVDKYIKIDEVRAEELKAQFGDEIVERKIVYQMNTALVEKHGEVISELIEKCGKIPDDDKAKLIEAIVSFEIKKGTISEMLNMDIVRNDKMSINEVITEVRPQFQNKNVKIDE